MVGEWAKRSAEHVGPRSPFVEATATVLGLFELVEPVGVD
jgi:hypothetical protein